MEILTFVSFSVNENKLRRNMMNGENDNNIMSGVNYVLLGIVVAIWYKTLLFRCINGFSRRSSLTILICIVIAYVSSGILVQWIVKHQEISVFQVFTDVIAGYGLYTVMTYYHICTMLVLIVSLVSLVLVIINATLTYSRKINKNSVSKKVLLKRRIRFINGLKGIVCVASVFIMAHIAFSSFFGSSLVKSTVNPAKQYEAETHTFASNLETLCLLRDEAWVKLSLEERLGVLQTIANIEQNYLGLSHELNVGAKTLDEGVLGCYYESEHLVLISIDCLLNESSYKCVEVTCHECRHAYQYCLTCAFESLDTKYKTLLLFSSVRSYKTEFNNYIDGKDDLHGYLSQKCENDAYLYGLMSADEYFQRINEETESAKNADLEVSTA